MTLRAVLLLTSIFLAVYLPTVLLASEWYVDASVAESGDGATLATAFKAIQEGINASSNGDTVTVAEGFYFENIEFQGKNIVLSSRDPQDPWIASLTVIDGTSSGPAVTFAGTEDFRCVLSGFTITRGIGTFGGGVCGRHTRATIENNLIRWNGALYGGGLYGCDGTVQNNVIVGNQATLGGGMCDCSGIIQSNDISGNLIVQAQEPTLYEALIRSNATISNGAKGGGRLHECRKDILPDEIAHRPAFSGGAPSSCDATIERDITSADQYQGSGGGLALCDGTIRYNVITENKADNQGGGLCACDGEILSNLIAGNSAIVRLGWGGGLASCNGMVVNNTIIGNAAKTGGGLHNCDGVVKKNCIIWANTATQAGPQVYNDSMASRIPTYSCIENWAGGGDGNTAMFPLFVNPSGPDNNPNTYDDNNYRLSWSPAIPSVCIDTGSNEPWLQHSTDLDGNLRIFYGLSSATVDMGAYEYGSFPFKVVDVAKLPGGGTQLTWNSRPGDTYVVWSRAMLYCPDLICPRWTMRATLSSQGIFTSWTDSAMPYDRLFYRVEYKP